MGAWGYGPFDNDTAGDWIGDMIFRPCRKAVEKFLRSRHGDGADEAFAAVALAADQGQDIFGGSGSETADFFEKLEASDAARGWKNPAARKKIVRALRSRVSRL